MVTVAELPAHLPRAVIAIEDKRFYEHGGIDPWGVARALFVNITSGKIRQGASTITQQLAKNLLLSHKRSYWRKAREALLALEIERKFGKDQILTVYLNRVYFGGGAYGVDAAARRFFGKPATEVSLWESALLAAVLKAPSRLAPDRNPDAAAARAKLVLNAMAEVGFISAADATQPMGVVSAAATALTAPGGGGARYFADWALDQAEGFMAGLDTDVLVETTLDLELQRAAEAAVAQILNNPPKGVGANWPSQAALVAMTPDGAVRAMVGGVNYRVSQFNRVTQAERQMGSTFKPFVFLAALEAGWEPGDRINDGPIRIGKWRPRNYKDRYYGDVTLRAALARSLNAAAVRLAESIGRDKAVTAARRLGLNRALPAGPSVTLGAGSASLLELTGAYAAFANAGRFATPHAIREIRGRDGTVLYQPVSEPSQAIDPAVAIRMTDMLGAAVKWGSGVRAKQGRDAAGKTGTSQEGRDGWFVGYTADLVAGVWVGHDDNRPIKNLSGSGPPAEIWGAFMKAAGARYAPKPLSGLHGYSARVVTRPAAVQTKKEEPADSPQFAPKKRPFVQYDYPEDEDRTD
jgi:penicillin-binding protein 1A